MNIRIIMILAIASLCIGAVIRVEDREIENLVGYTLIEVDDVHSVANGERVDTVTLESGTILVFERRNVIYEHDVLALFERDNDLQVLTSRGHRLEVERGPEAP